MTWGRQSNSMFWTGRYAKTEAFLSLGLPALPNIYALRAIPNRVLPLVRETER